ncbi:MAG: ferredoxin [Candidatus Diapherotrites archaeon]|nr:ferredoxin [Candidatus Diapherotrites archaeon]
MGKYKIEHDRPNCIGCAACASVNPDFWTMDADGKSDIVGGKKLANGEEELDIEDKDFQANKEAADVCPVNVIHIRDKEKDKRLI